MSTFAAGKRRIVAINAAGGGTVDIAATAGARRVVIQECAPGGGTFNGSNFAPQGINYSTPDDGFVQVFPLLPDDIFQLDNPNAAGRGAGALQGGPAQTDPAGRTVPARVYCKMVSAALATQVLVIEYA